MPNPIESVNISPGIPLTGAARLTIVVEEPEMPRPVQVANTRAVCVPRVCLCLLIATLFLYNPFLATPNYFGELNLRHPARNRATVGASELQQFKVGDEGSKIKVPVSAATESPLALPGPAEPAPSLFLGKVSPPRQFLSASLWFRPPPAS
jgi:hypothetical protein